MSASRFITATKIHDGKQWMPEGSVLEIDVSRKLTAIHEDGQIPKEQVQAFEGIICPGFVNAHGHMELSHLKGAIPTGTGLVDFLMGVVTQRVHFSEEEKEAALLDAIAQQKQNGIVAVGDIANGTDTLKHRANAGLHTHTFIESLGFAAEKASNNFQYADSVYQQFAAQKSSGHYLQQSIVPHAPYSVSKTLFGLISEHQPNAILSIHNQETAAENELFQQGTGTFHKLFAALGFSHFAFSKTGKSSLQSYAEWLAETHPLLLVHNTFSTKADIDYLRNTKRRFTFCLCPGANKYIEGTLPNVELLRQEQVPICIGTDSLSSNHQLDVMAELALLQGAYPELGWEEMLRWICFNGAEALQMSDRVGSLSPGLRPGIIHLQFDEENWLAKGTTISVLFPSANP